jgi:plastocyanin
MFKSRDIARRHYCLTVAVLAVLALVLAACAPAASNTPVPTAAPPPQPTAVPPAAAPTSVVVTIEMINTSFSPATVQVKAGTTVVWVNKDPVEHSTTSDSNLWDSGVMGAGATFSYTFTQPGTYPYYCKPHLALGMTGVITVVP